MSFSQVMMTIMAVFLVVACFDRCIFGKLGFAKTLENGFALMPAIALGVVGMYCLSPIIAQGLSFALTPIFTKLGMDPTVFVATFIAGDGGAYFIAEEMTNDIVVRNWACFSIGELYGNIFAFVIPVGIGIVKKEDYDFFVSGVLCAIIASPIGCIAAGIFTGMSIGSILLNLVFPLLISLLVIILLVVFPKAVSKVFSVFAHFVTILITIGLALAGFQSITGIVIVEGLGDINIGWQTVGIVALIISGAWSLVHLIEVLLKKPLAAIGRAVGINTISVSAFLVALVQPLPSLARFNEMDNRGKIIVSALAATTGFLLGPMLAFASTYCPEAVGLMFVAKIVAGIVAIPLAVFYFRSTHPGALEKTADSVAE